ncbi:MAG: type IV pilus secretin PilQ [bacterium]
MRKHKLIITTIFSVLAVLLCFSFGSVITAQDEVPDARLTNVAVEEVDSENVKVVISTDMPVHYKYFKLNTPPVVAVDLIHTIHAWPQKSIDTGEGIVSGVRSAQNRVEPRKITRVVIELTESELSYKVTQVDNEIIVLMGPSAEGMEEEIVEKVEKAASIEKIVQEEPIEPPVPPAVEVEEVAVPELPVHTPSVPIPPVVEVIEEVVPVAEAPPLVAVPASAEETAVEQREDGEELLTLNFKDADIRDVLRVMSLKSGINMVYGDDVVGAVTVHLDRVTFDDAFDIILSLRGLTYEKVTDNVYRIATPNTIATERAGMITSTEVFVLNYAEGSDISGSLGSVLSSQGKIQVDIRTNSLIVTDTPANLKKVANMIEVLDVETPQVMIEAQIVEIGTTDLQYLGINWNATRQVPYQDTTSDVTLTMLPAGPTFTPGAGGTLTVSTIMSSAQLNATLNALATKGKSKILSNPKISTVNNKEAKILVGDKVPYTLTTTTTTGTTSSTAYIDVGIKLLVTPNINANNMITLKVHPEVSFVKEWRAEGPVISTREADTEVLIKSGETVVIGGLIKEEDKQDASKVPFLGEIPILGYLFSQKLSDKQKTELLVFITPRVLGEE